jgi:hypothetical protein
MGVAANWDDPLAPRWNATSWVGLYHPGVEQEGKAHSLAVPGTLERLHRVTQERDTTVAGRPEQLCTFLHFRSVRLTMPFDPTYPSYTLGQGRIQGDETMEAFTETG